MKRTKSLTFNHIFKRLYYKGKVIKTPYFIVYYMKNYTKNVDRNINFLGITVGKKLGIAVTRNRVRRIIRESFAQIEKKLKSPYFFVIVGRVKAIDKKTPIIYNTLAKALYKNDLILDEYKNEFEGLFSDNNNKAEK